MAATPDHPPRPHGSYRPSALQGYEGFEADAAMQLDEQDCNSNGSSPEFGFNAGRLSAERQQLQHVDPTSYITVPGK